MYLNQTPICKYSVIDLELLRELRLSVLYSLGISGLSLKIRLIEMVEKKWLQNRSNLRNIIEYRMKF